MKRFARLALAVMAVLPAIAHAGTRVPAAVPTLGEMGLITFGVGLLGGGVYLIRKRGR